MTTKANESPLLPEPEVAARFQHDLLDWFESNRRDLPWRRTRDPYQILVSEVMLQQTQVDRVLPYYARFLERFPNVAALAAAPVAEVIRLWSGLGYNRRAVNLHRTAVAIMDEYGGVFPASVDALRSLPGIGEYTAGAIACFAFEQDVAFLDTNMRRVLERVYLDPDSTPEKRAASDIAVALMPEGDGWRWNQGLIEFGALQCTARSPACLLCPARTYCRSAGSVRLRSQSPGSRATKPIERFEETNRYFRGRIVEVLRDPDNAKAGLSFDEIGRHLKPDYSNDHLPWVTDLILGLERDGLAAIAEESASYDTELPSTTRVRLP